MLQDMFVERNQTQVVGCIEMRVVPTCFDRRDVRVGGKQKVVKVPGELWGREKRRDLFMQLL